MKSDPRVCKIPMTEFSHLSQKDVKEFELFDEMYQAKPFLNPVARYLFLLKRRVCPGLSDRGHNKGDAA